LKIYLIKPTHLSSEENKNKNMETQKKAQSEQCSPGVLCTPQAQVKAQPSDFDFDIARTYLVLTATLILPIYLALSVVSFSMGALIA